MFYILIGVLIAVFSFIGFRIKKGEFEPGSISRSFIIGILGLMLSAVFIGGILSFMEPKTYYFSEKYSLEKIEGNQYYTVNTGSNSVSLYARKETFSEKMTFSEEVVKFNTHVKKATVQIEGKRYKEPTKKEKFWFFTHSPSLKDDNGKSMYPDEYQRVIISLPEGYEIQESIMSGSTETNVNVTGKLKW